MNDKHGNRGLYITLAGVAVFFAALELLKPYYFLQNDNRDYILPCMAHVFRGLLAGTPAFFNFHQYCGTPFFSMGQTAVFYPPSWLSAALSKLLTGELFAAVDIFIFLHLAAGAAGFFRLLEYFGAREEAAAAGAFAWTLNGFSVFLGSSWGYITAPTAYLPWLTLLSLKFFDTGRLRPLLLATALRVMFLYLGFMQFFIYSCLFEALFISLRNSLKYGAAWLKSGPARLYAAGYAAVFAAGLPLIAAMWRQVSDSAIRAEPFGRQMAGAMSNSIPLWLWGNIIPQFHGFAGESWFALLRARFFSGLNWYESFLPYYSHMGWLTLLLLCWFPLWRRGGGKERAAALLCGALAFGWAMGWFNSVICFIPVLNRMKFNFKLTLFLNFFLMLAAYLNMSLWLDSIAPARRKLAGRLLAASSLLGFFMIYAVSPHRGFLVHLDKVPFCEPLEKELSDGRIFTLGVPREEGAEHTAALLGFNYATLRGLRHFAGYDPLVGKLNSRIANGLNISAAADIKPDELPSAMAYLRAWGVKWYVLDSRDSARYRASLLKLGLREKFSDARRVIFHDSGALPLVRWRATGTDAAIAAETGVNTMTVRTDNPRGDYLNFAVVWNAGFGITLDGKPQPLERTPHGQMAVFVPGGRHEAVLKYRPVFF